MGAAGSILSVGNGGVAEHGGSDAPEWAVVRDGGAAGEGGGSAMEWGTAGRRPHGTEDGTSVQRRDGVHEQIRLDEQIYAK